MLNGDVQFPENNTIYNQSAATSLFSWSLGDGTVQEGQSITYTYPQPGAYYVNLFVRDAYGCTSDTDLHIRVRVAEPPSVAIVQNPPAVMAGTPVSLKANVAPAAVYSFTDQLFFGIATQLPDGNGAYVDMPLMVSGYPAGATLQPGQIESICVNMEHSWLRDLELKITCPNGQSAILHNFAGQTGGETFLGDPYENDEGFDVLIPGVGYDYCWTPTPNIDQTWIQYANSHPNMQTLPSGSYKPYESLDSLAGCPLNGNWNFTSVDLWAIDNGYLFNWSLSFDTTNFTNPNEESFSAITNTAAWEQDPSIIYYSADSIVAVPQLGSQYVFKSSNDFGCNDEKAIAVNCGVATTIIGTHCFEENYSIEVNGVIYDHNNPSGTETIMLPNGCDSVITVDLNFLDPIAAELNLQYCLGDCVPGPGGGNMICSDTSFVYNLVSYHGCDSVVTVNFIFTDVSVANIVKTCDPTGEYYTVSFQVLGGDIDCGDIPVGGVFTSNPIPSGSPYSFEINCNVCQPIVVSGALTCNCLSSPGTMDTTTIKVCEGEVAMGIYDSAGEFFDPNDTRCFFLVSGSSFQPIAQSSTPEFGFNPSIMTYGTLYHMVAVVGNADASGCVDLSDPCFYTSSFTPVIFYENTEIEANAAFDSLNCFGEDVALYGNGGEEYLWTGPNNFISTAQNPIVENISAAQTGTYQLIVSKTCAQPDTAEIFVEFNCIYVADTIQLDEVGDLLCGYSVSAVNQCPESDQSATLNYDMNLDCVFYTGVSIGVDTICLTAQNNLGNIVGLRLFVTVVEPSAVGDRLADDFINIFPNPADAELLVHLNEAQSISMDVFDMTGRFVQHYAINGFQGKIPTSSWAEGVYILKFTTSSGVFGKSVLVKH